MTERSKPEPTSDEFAVVAGAGDLNLVGLHGFGGAADAFRAVAHYLAPHGRLWSADLFGHRGTPWPEAARDFASSVACLAARIRAIPPPRYLLGYSMGARLGLSAWGDDDDLFIGATLVGVHPGLSTADDREARRALDRERASRLRARGVEEFFEAWDRDPMFVGRSPQAQPWRPEHDVEGLARALTTWSLGRQPDWRLRIDRLSSENRLLLVVGEADWKFRRRLAQWDPRLLPGGHDLPSQAPRHLAEAVVEHLRTKAIRERSSES